MGQMRNMPKLKPCPFCGEHAYIDICLGNMYITAHHKNCAMAPNTWLISNESIRKQVKAWNSRK